MRDVESFRKTVTLISAETRRLMGSGPEKHRALFCGCFVGFGCASSQSVDGSRVGGWGRPSTVS